MDSETLTATSLTLWKGQLKNVCATGRATPPPPGPWPEEHQKEDCGSALVLKHGHSQGKDLAGFSFPPKPSSTEFGLPAPLQAPWLNGPLELDRSSISICQASADWQHASVTV